MAKHVGTTKVWSPEGLCETHTAANARDLIMHSGWSTKDPNATPVAVNEESNDTNDSGNEDGQSSFEETEAKRLADEKAADEAAEAQKLADKKAADEAAETKRLEDEKSTEEAAEAQRLADEKAADEAAEAQRLADEKAADEAKAPKPKRKTSSKK